MATVPPAPKVVGIDIVTPVSLRYRFASRGNGGSEILQWQIGYGPDPQKPKIFITSTGTSTIKSLSPGHIYYFWSRGRNKLGWGPWSARTQQRTIAGAWVKVKGVWRLAVPYVKTNGVWKLAQGYMKSGGVWKKVD